jgi:photosystem II stability/assembly factor-like uncharacterized protein
MKANYLNKKFLKDIWVKSLFLKEYINKSRRLYVIVVLLSFIVPVFTSAQATYGPNQNWKWLHPTPQGNIIRWVKMWDKNTWYMAGMNGTFMKTTDGGASWIISYNAARDIVNLGANTADGDVNDAHFFNQNTGILVGNLSSVYKTTDGGITFDSIPGLFRPDAPNWNSIFFLNNNTGYITGHSGGLAKTTDGGNTWVHITNVPTGHHYDLWTPNGTLIIICSGAGKIQRSTNGGTGWATINTPTTFFLRKLCFINNDTGFASGDNTAVILTTDGGQNWTNANSGLPSSRFSDIDYKITGQNTEVYLTGNAYHIYKTTNFGGSWSQVEFWGPSQSYMGLYMSYNSTELGGGDTLLTVGSYGLINKRNSPSEKILYTNFVKFAGTGYNNDLWVIGNNIWVAGNPTGSGGPMDDQILFSSNGGASWVKQNTMGSAASFTSIYMLNSNTGYVAGTGGAISKTIDGGGTWNPITSPTTTNLTYIEFVDMNTGWVFGLAGTIYKTTDAGASWVQQTAAGFTGLINNADMVDANTGWIVGSGPKISKTTDGGLNWITQIPNTPNEILGIKMVDNTTGYFGGVSHLRKTTNGGANWDTLAVPFSIYQLTGIDFIDSQTGMIIYDFLTLKTTTGGASWIIDEIGTAAICSQIAITRIKMVTENSAYLTGNHASVMKYSTGPVGIIEWETGVPEKYELYQNYPNPFNPTTTIKFAIPKAANISLKIYDITGREVKTIINNLHLNAGTAKYTFEGSEYASGVYFYSLYSEGSLIMTKKMVLVK